MLTFLRKIRKSVIESGSTRKYLLYAIGEIALVVIGILIALQINNWNEEINQNATIANYLQHFIEDLTADQEYFEANEVEAYFRYYSLQYLLGLCGEQPYDPLKDGHIIEDWQGNKLWDAPIPEKYNREFIELAFIWIHRAGRNSVNSSTIEELKNTGLYSQLNKSLKNAINDYYDDWDFRFGPLAFQKTQETIGQFQNLLMDFSVINSTPYVNGDPIEILKTSPALRGRLRNMVAHASWHAMSCKIIYKEAFMLQELVESEIENM